jgi:hypothetical protein
MGVVGTARWFVPLRASTSDVRDDRARGVASVRAAPPCSAGASNDSQWPTRGSTASCSRSGIDGVAAKRWSPSGDARGCRRWCALGRRSSRPLASGLGPRGALECLLGIPGLVARHHQSRTWAPTARRWRIQSRPSLLYDPRRRWLRGRWPAADLRLRLPCSSRFKHVRRLAQHRVRGGLISRSRAGPPRVFVSDCLRGRCGPQAGRRRHWPTCGRRC